MSLLSAAAALALSFTTPAQTLPADRATYGALVDCAATWRVSMAKAIGAGDGEARDAAALQFTAFQALTRLYGAGLSLPETTADAAVREQAWAKLVQNERLGRTEEGRRLRDQAHQGEEAACTALAGRIARENAEAG